MLSTHRLSFSTHVPADDDGERKMLGLCHRRPSNRLTRMVDAAGWLTALLVSAIWLDPRIMIDPDPGSRWPAGIRHGRGKSSPTRPRLPFPQACRALREAARGGQGRQHDSIWVSRIDLQTGVYLIFRSRLVHPSKLVHSVGA